MKLFLKRFEKTYLFLIKALLLASLFVTFFGFYMQMLPQLDGLNRTSAVSLSEFTAGFRLGNARAAPSSTQCFSQP